MKFNTAKCEMYALSIFRVLLSRVKSVDLTSEITNYKLLLCFITNEQITNCCYLLFLKNDTLKVTLQYFT